MRQLFPRPGEPQVYMNESPCGCGGTFRTWIDQGAEGPMDHNVHTAPSGEVRELHVSMTDPNYAGSFTAWADALHAPLPA